MKKPLCQEGHNRLFEQPPKIEFFLLFSSDIGNSQVIRPCAHRIIVRGRRARRMAWLFPFPLALVSVIAV